VRWEREEEHRSSLHTVPTHHMHPVLHASACHCAAIPSVHACVRFNACSCARGVCEPHLHMYRAPAHVPEVSESHPFPPTWRAQVVRSPDGVCTNWVIPLLHQAATTWIAEQVDKLGNEQDGKVGGTAGTATRAGSLLSASLPQSSELLRTCALLRARILCPAARASVAPGPGRAPALALALHPLPL